GEVTALPGLEPSALGERRELTYAADGWKVTVAGAEGFYVHPGGDEQLYRGLARAEQRVVGAWGEVEDLGGAFVVRGTDQLVVSTAEHAWSTAPDTRTVSGVATGATDLVLYAAGELVGRAAIDGAFRVEVPADVDAVRAEARGRTPSPTVPVGLDLRLGVGAEASLAFSPTWDDGRDHLFRVDWTAADGRTGLWVFPPDGGELALGAGDYTLTVDAGPAFGPLVLHETLGPDEHREVPLALAPTLDPDQFVVARFGLPMDRSTHWRGSDPTALALAAAGGASYATFTPVDDVGAGLPDLADDGPLRVQTGLLHRGDGWTIGAWPWSSSSKKALHGGPAFWTGDPSDDAALAWGGPDDARTLWVDLGWLDAVDPNAADPAPDLVALAAPGPELSGFAPWFRWLDAHRFVVPTGPVTWVRVDAPRDPGRADIEQGLTRGDVCAGTGPLVLLTVATARPGDTLGPRTVAPARIEVRNAGSADTYAVVSDGRVWSAPLPADGLALDRAIVVPERWVAAAVWSSADPDGTWAITAPVWTRAP
ncbi:MAG: hypothetical protein ABMA64_27590, partial [Myxococcota bacterium]